MFSNVFICYLSRKKPFLICRNTSGQVKRTVAQGAKVGNMGQSWPGISARFSFPSLPLLHLPSSQPFSPLAFPSSFSPGFPVYILAAKQPQNSVRGLGERSKFLSGLRDGATATNAFSAYFKPRKLVCWQRLWFGLVLSKRMSKAL